MTRKEILDKINQIIEEEHGREVTEESLLTDCEIDSFGYALLWLGLENDIVKTPEDVKIFSREYTDSIDYGVYKVGEIVDKLEEAADVYRELQNTK